MKVYVIFGQVKWEGSTLLFIFEDAKKAKRKLVSLENRLKRRKDNSYDYYDLEEYEVIK